MQKSIIQSSFWKGKKIFLTGHTGFKGGWLSLWLSSMGARVTGYALAPNTNPSFFKVCSIEEMLEKSHLADIRDLQQLQAAMQEAQPEIVIHMAAQPLVRYSYNHPVETYATNVMGTVHVLECIRLLNTVKSAVMVTSDKCYENKEWVWGYRENEPMGGHDPYSNSKGCAELVTSAYRSSYFSQDNSVAIASARAGNVIGGGDWSEDRLIPDAIKAFENHQALIIRNPLATRPWQHVLEPLSGYLTLAQALYEEGAKAYASGWNFGPKEEDVRSVQSLVELLIKQWGTDARWELENNAQPYEAQALQLDCSKARQSLGWFPRWSLEQAIEKITDWQKAFQSQKNMQDLSLQQIHQYTSY
ncbi:CDP-glucose 4,6-dehydratase [Polynucleobacter kasalickyi]|uniref:CDP-glucose 4,6-dehydratase n=1 Tax=Polynucleobacter kasalickyi TaxID=1938817 RepID=A0A1W1Y1P4_9BURK|nr:CDP-glucose 4,6-dehydratase [Polynucleobacter kasalickyi]SMC30066.1 CDP-glucose 4,6-dehydratase [Polynucleobacter kasalickyi]